MAHEFEGNMINEFDYIEPKVCEVDCSLWKIGHCAGTKYEYLTHCELRHALGKKQRHRLQKRSMRK